MWPLFLSEISCALLTVNYLEYGFWVPHSTPLNLNPWILPAAVQGRMPSAGRRNAWDSFTFHIGIHAAGQAWEGKWKAGATLTLK